MKRKNWRVNTEPPSRTGPSSHQGSRGVLRSKTLLNDAETQADQGVSCRKRVRFRDLDSSKLQESASVPLERVQDSKSDEPKTSEYAFFKKLREETLHARPLHHDNNQSINQKVSQNSSRGKMDVTHTQNVGGRSMSHKNLKTQLPKNATPDNLSLCTSTPDFASAFDMKRVGTTSSDIRNKQENMDQCGAPCHNLDVFSRKRHKLHQLAAKTLSVEVDELFSNGNDTVSVLLSKLFPVYSGNKSFEDLKTRTAEIDTQSESFTSQKFDMRINECQWTPARNFLELEYDPQSDVGFSFRWSESRTQDRPISISPYCYSLGSFLDEVMELDYKRSPPILFTGDDMNLDICKHQCLTSRRHNELDEFPYSIKPLNVQEPQSLLLGWDEDNMVDESTLSAASTSKELILHPFLSIVHDDGRQNNIDSSFTANEFRYPIKSFYRQETPNLLLGWDVDNMVDESNLSPVSQNTELSLNCFLNSHSVDQEKNWDDSFVESALCTEPLVSYQPAISENTELSLNCFLPIRCSGDQKKNFDDSFTEARLSTESLMSYLPPNLMPLQFSSSTGKTSHEKDDIFAGKHFSPCFPEMINQLEMNESFASNGSNISLCPPNQLCSWRNFLNERKHYPDEEDFSSVGYDFYTEIPRKPVSGSSRDRNRQAFHALECPQSEHLSPYLIGDVNENRLSSHRGTNSHLCDDIIDIHNRSSNYVQSALDREKSYPLLLDKSHQNEYNEENLF